VVGAVAAAAGLERVRGRTIHRSGIDAAGRGVGGLGGGVILWQAVDDKRGRMGLVE
jgi:hypothetical protein